MITNEDLRREGFEYSEDSQEWKRNNIILKEYDGKVISIKLGETYAKVRIIDVRTLKTVISVIC